MDASRLAALLEQAERSSPAVRAATLARIARLQIVLAPSEARATFERGLKEAQHLSGYDRTLVLEQARYAAAAVAPDLLAQIPSMHRGGMEAAAVNLCSTMLDHGRASAAVAFVLDPALEGEFPMHAVLMIMQHVADEATRLALIRRAIAAAREDPRGLVGILPVLQMHWRILRDHEAHAVLHDLVRAIEEGPELNSQGSYGYEEPIEITAGRENLLFQILGAIRHLEPTLADELMTRHAQLAAAARRYPHGFDSVMEESRQRAAACVAPGSRRGYVMAGDPQDFAYMRALIDAEEDGEFAPPMVYALERLHEETSAENPNQAPVVCWASTNEYCSILYRAGKRLGADAARLLDEIPDVDVRLFAEIEFAAALVGLPELRTFQSSRRKRAFAGPARELEPATPMRTGDAPGGSDGPPRIRCPKCNWSPDAESRWRCHCGHAWNTFDTGGVCPGCMYQWQETACLRCHQWSPHSDWYTHKF
jgi:hypothetical protein